MLQIANFLPIDKDGVASIVGVALLSLLGLVLGIIIVIFVLPRLASFIVDRLVFPKRIINDVVVPADKARSLQIAGKFEDAIAVYYDLIQQETNNKNLWLEMLRIIVEREEGELCYQYVNEALALENWSDIDIADFLLIKADVEWRLIDLKEEAINTYQSILKLENTSNMQINQVKRWLSEQANFSE